MSNQAMLLMQTTLAELGFDPGPLDGVGGDKTAAAVRAFLEKAGLLFTVTVTSKDVTIRGPNLPKSALRDQAAPWLTVAASILGLHERSDNAALRRFLSSDGKTLGDPAKLPWCGDFAATCIKLALPDEPFPGDLGKNPYWARNWGLFGEDTEPCLGAIVVFERGPKAGHVGFLVGEDATHFYVLGGNQSDGVTIARIDKRRAYENGRKLGIRWASTIPNPKTPLPRMVPGQTSLSTNEA